MQQGWPCWLRPRSSFRDAEGVSSDTIGSDHLFAPRTRIGLRASGTSILLIRRPRPQVRMDSRKA
jgi:hypothetical protein